MLHSVIACFNVYCCNLYCVFCGTALNVIYVYVYGVNHIFDTMLCNIVEVQRFTQTDII